MCDFTMQLQGHKNGKTPQPQHFPRDTRLFIKFSIKQGTNFAVTISNKSRSFSASIFHRQHVMEGVMDKIYVDISNLQTLIFERRQIVALLDDIELWQQIPLAERFAIVESSEFVTLMGESFTDHARRMLENEIEAMLATIH